MRRSSLFSLLFACTAACVAKVSVDDTAEALAEVTWGPITGDGAVQGPPAGASRHGPTAAYWRDAFAPGRLVGSLPPLVGDLHGDWSGAPDVVVDGVAYYISSAGVTAHDLATNVRKWAVADAFAPDTYFHAGDRLCGVVASGGVGNHVACRALDDGRELWKTALPQQVAPTTSGTLDLFAHDGLLYVSGEQYAGYSTGRLTALDLADGTQKFTKPSMPGPRSVVVAGDVLLFSGRASDDFGAAMTVSAIDRRTGAAIASTPGTATVIREETGGVVLRVDVAVGERKYLRFDTTTKAFTDVSSAFEAFETLASGYRFRWVTGVGDLRPDGTQWLAATTTNGDVNLYAWKDGSTELRSVGAPPFRIHPNAVVSANRFGGASVSPLDGSGESSFARAFFVERWAFADRRYHGAP